MNKEKVMVFDKPLVKTQKFEVSFPGQKGRVTVIRKEVIRLIHHMGCTDGLLDDHVERNISYEIYREVCQQTRIEAIKEVNKELKRMKDEI